MDKLLSAIKCPECLQTLSMPVLLPCGHVICQSHTKNKQDQVIACASCGQSHHQKEFIVIKPLSDIIEAKIDTLDFGKTHADAKQTLEKLQHKFETIDKIFKDPEFFIHESLNGLLLTFDRNIFKNYFS